MWSQELLDLKKKCAYRYLSPTSIKLSLSLDPGRREKPLHLDAKLLLRAGPPFSDLIRPYIGALASLEISNLEEYGDFAQLFPDFPEDMINLHELRISLSIPGEKRLWPINPVLESLSLVCRSSCKINTLTRFSFIDPNFLDPPDTLFTFLRGNRLLEHLELEIPVRRHSKAQAPINLERLRSLSVTCKHRADIKYLISCVPLPSGGQLTVTSTKKDIRLSHMLSSIMPVERSPSLIHVNYDEIETSIRWSGPNGAFYFRGLSPQTMSSVLTGSLLFSLDNVRELHLTEPPPDSVSASPSLFSSLKILTIRRDPQISTTLSQLFSPELSFSPDKLEIASCPLTREDEKRVREFASKRQSAVSPSDFVTVKYPRGQISTKRPQDPVCYYLVLEHVRAENRGRI